MSRRLLTSALVALLGAVALGWQLTMVAPTPARYVLVTLGVPYAVLGLAGVVGSELDRPFVVASVGVVLATAFAALSFRVAGLYPTLLNEQAMALTSVSALVGLGLPVGLARVRNGWWVIAGLAALPMLVLLWFYGTLLTGANELGLLVTLLFVTVGLGLTAVPATGLFALGRDLRG